MSAGKRDIFSREVKLSAVKRIMDSICQGCGSPGPRASRPLDGFLDSIDQRCGATGRRPRHNRRRRAATRHADAVPGARGSTGLATEGSFARISAEKRGNIKPNH